MKTSSMVWEVRKLDYEEFVALEKEHRATLFINKYRALALMSSYQAAEQYTELRGWAFASTCFKTIRFLSAIGAAYLLFRGHWLWTLFLLAECYFISKGLTVSALQKIGEMARSDPRIYQYFLAADYFIVKVLAEKEAS